jgi:hypothetical protein
MRTNKRYFLPPNIKQSIAEFIHNPRYYKHFSAIPKLYRNVISTALENIKKMPSRKDKSSSTALAKGKRRTRRRRTRRTRRTRRRK